MLMLSNLAKVMQLTCSFRSLQLGSKAQTFNHLKYMSRSWGKLSLGDKKLSF